MITTEQYNQHLNNWKGTIHKTMFKLSQINNLNYAYQQDLLQVGRIAVYEALIASQTNGKTGNDANGLIASYVDNRMKDFCTQLSQIVRKPKRHYYDKEFGEKMGSDKINYIPSAWIEDEVEYDPDNDDNKTLDDEEYYQRKAIKLAMNDLNEKEKEIIKNNYSHKPIIQPKIAENFGLTIGQLQSLISKKFPAIVNDYYIRLKTKQRKYNELQSTS